ncbi:MAG: hypothetical protein AAF573_20475 [Bacteroidota bacterium]
MAKKKFNISSTLNKNKKEDSIELAPKVPLKKVEKDPEAIKSKVEKIHASESKKDADEKDQSLHQSEKVSSQDVESATDKPRSATKPSRKKATKIVKPRIVRMTIDTPEDIHLQLKIKSIQSRMTMKDYVLRLIEKDLKKG